MHVMKRLKSWLIQLRDDTRGEVFVEYILLLTIVGLGAITGMAVLRASLINELSELASAIDGLF